MPGDLGMLDVIHAGPPQPAVAQNEAAGLDDVDRHPQTGAESDEGAGILRNIGLEEGEAHDCQSFRGERRGKGGRHGAQLRLCNRDGMHYTADQLPTRNNRPVGNGGLARAMRQDVA